MFLEKLEIQGFKSFANKNILQFPGMLDNEKRGLTSVVGPNGSGKSNVADAVRWALGEQSMKTLRGKKSEDVIFSGSDKKGKLGMAEVSLHLNNEGKDGEKAPIDYSQIVLTRRLYRSGESEYLLNGGRVRLSEIQMLLARAKFGQKTYSVIGQGMVEGFLNTSLAERKEFFDEATGVKQYQIKRDESLSKLRSSYENLAQTQMLLQEIEPRLKSLTRQVGRLQRRGEMEKELRVLQKEYYGIIWHDIYRKFNEYNKEYLELEKIKFGKEKKQEGLNRELEQLKAAGGQKSEYEERQKEMNVLQGKKDALNRRLAKIEAQIETKLEAGGQHDLSFLFNRKEAGLKERENIREEISLLEKEITAGRESGIPLQEERNRIDREIRELNDKLAQVSRTSDSDEMKNAHDLLHRLVADLEQVEEITDFDEIKALTVRIKKELKKIKRIILKEGKDPAEDKAFAELQAVLRGLAENKEASANKINENNLRLSGKSERLRMLKEKSHSLDSELANIEARLKQGENKVNYQELEVEQAGIKSELAEIQEKIGAVRDVIGKISAAEEEKRRQLFALQNDLQGLQNELNTLNNQMQSVKISATRHETKLEDLEIEIREELQGLGEIKNNPPAEGVGANSNGQKEKISQIKHQLELIGGIDPQTEAEYNETKERFDFLNGQIEDFGQAIDSLRKIIKELDLTIKEQFDKEFKVIAQNFEKYFKILFNGGSAKIVKVMDDSEEKENAASESASAEGVLKEKPEEVKKSGLASLPDVSKIKYLQKHNATGLAGIEIQATPPGKKISSISMLSGGERALTAIALICAIINSNPSPFVVLDEVDAALDEANSERLAKILDELSHRTQFIVITHNRAPMRRSSILYGVTMGDDGVSKLLSIKLDDVKGGK